MSSGNTLKLLKDGCLAEDIYTDASALPEIPAEGAVLVSLEQWQANREALLARGTPVGVRLKSDQHPEAIREDLPRLALVALEFPKFRDGRAYTYARLLRERYGYQGEVRAVGDVLQEQLNYMQRCGFNAFQMERDPLAAWEAVKNDHTVWYQATGDGRPRALDLRHRQ
jgi:uncharacterized protein (DUF934 family)